MARKRKQNQPVSLADHINNVPMSGLSFTRYTYDAWKKCYPNSNHEEYEEKQVPPNYMGYLQNLYMNMELNKVNNQELPVYQILLDDKYFEWLKETGKENTEENRCDYTNVAIQDENMTDRIAAEGLDTSLYPYLIPVCGVVDRPTISTQLSQETVDTVKKYIEKLVDNDKFSIWVSPYLFKPDTVINDFNRILSLAQNWFNHSKKVRIGKYASASFRGTEGQIVYAVLYLPVFIREKISAPVTLNEIADTIGLFDAEDAFELDLENVGRFLDFATATDGFFDEMGCEPIEESDVSKALKDELKNAFVSGTEVDVFYDIISAFEAADFYEETLSEIEKEMKKNGQKVYHL